MPLWTAEASQVEAMVVLEAVLLYVPTNAAEGVRGGGGGVRAKKIHFCVEVSKIVCF